MDFSSNHDQLVDSRLIQKVMVFLMCSVLRINCFHSFISYTWPVRGVFCFYAHFSCWVSVFFCKSSSNSMQKEWECTVVRVHVEASPIKLRIASGVITFLKTKQYRKYSQPGMELSALKNVTVIHSPIQIWDHWHNIFPNHSQLQLSSWHQSGIIPGRFCMWSHTVSKT